MKTTKTLFFGILIGMIITTVIPVRAMIQEYALSQSEWKVIVDGIEVEDERYPVLLLPPGYNYIAAGNFRDICAKAGIPFSSDVPTKEIRIETKKIEETIEAKTVVTPTVAPTPVPTIALTKAPIPTQPPKEEKPVEIPLNKYGLPDFTNNLSKRPYAEDNGTNTFFTHNGVKYISISSTPNRPKLLPEDYRFEKDMVDGKLSEIITLKEKNPETKIWETLIKEVPYADFGVLVIQYDYYQNTILPLIKE